MKFLFAFLALSAAYCVSGSAVQAAAGAPAKSTLATLDYILENCEGLAEGAVTGSLGVTVAHRVAADWTALRPSLASQGADPKMLASVDGAVTALNDAASHSQDLRISANNLTGALAPVFGFAGAEVPWQFMRIEYLRRSVGLAADIGDWKTVARSEAALDQTWGEMRPRVVAKNAAKAAARFDAALADVKSATDKRDVKATDKAVAGAGDAVDGLETAFGG
jgi:hypothetical protein